MVDISQVDVFVDKYGGEKRALTALLLDIQGEYNYLPREALQRVAERIKLPLLQVYQVASFYKAFSLEPRGKHLVTVCLGTACHVRGGPRLVDQVERLLKLTPGQTTKDRQFTLETVNCLGCCALGPIIVVDGKYYGKMAASGVEKVLKPYQEAEEATANG
jgi:NADH-quinone oxidoreductase subunit E